MQKFYQTEWFNIQFSSFIEMNASKQADEEFYNKFYAEFFKKFSSYSELSNKWKEEKEQVVNFIYENIKNYNKILSIGCGNGYIEYSLNKKWGGK